MATSDFNLQKINSFISKIFWLFIVKVLRLELFLKIVLSSIDLVKYL